MLVKTSIHLRSGDVSTVGYDLHYNDKLNMFKLCSYSLIQRYGGVQSKNTLLKSASIKGIDHKLTIPFT